NLRALRLHQIARAAVERFRGELPGDVDALLALPGIGPYTAAAVACFAFGAPVATVDTNIRRVLSRVRLGRHAGHANAARAPRPPAARVPPRDRAYDRNQALLDLGATICTARNPRHLICPLRDECRYVGRASGAEERRVAEPRAAYGTQPRTPSPKERYEGSSRYYRGRVVDRPRALIPGEAVTLAEPGSSR